MHTIQKYIQELKNIYGKEMEISPSQYHKTDLEKVPCIMQKFYCSYEKIKFPFGIIYPIETAIKASQREPFHHENWFCFGQDNYFSFWLCKYTPDEENLSFTTWDHEGGSEIDEAVFETLIELLDDVRMEDINGFD